MESAIRICLQIAIAVSLAAEKNYSLFFSGLLQKDSKLHTLVMLDVDSRSTTGGAPYVHWLEVNIPGARFEEGETIAEYNSPAPPRGEGKHR